MKKIIYSLLFAFLPLSLFSITFSGIEIETRSALFYPTSQLFRDLYGRGKSSFQVEATSPLYGNTENFANFDYFSKGGHTRGGCRIRTNVKMATLGMGLKHSFNYTDRIITYLGIGPSFAQIRLHNHTPCGRKHHNKFSVGGVLKSGVYYFILPPVFLDVFADYTYQPVRFDNCKDVGGYRIGLAIGGMF